MASWVLTPCKRSRLDELKAMLTSIGADPEHTVVVTTLPDPIEAMDLAGYANHLLTFERPGMLFGAWFNYGYDYLSAIDDGPYEVLCIGSSLIGAVDTIPTLRGALRGCGLTMVGPDMHGRVQPGEVTRETFADQRTLWNRVPAQCFMVPGELGLRFDPAFRWFYSDDDLEMQARQLGPVGLLGGERVRMTHPDGHYLSEEQATWATEDRAKFITKWGHEPW